ncbi:MAG: restriction endonuclease [Candidatus Thiodiazotropha endolucinida]
MDRDQMQELEPSFLRAMGYITRITKPGPDRGVDIMA